MYYIHCPDCDAVREMDAAACPECGRCANCGEKVAEAMQICRCGFPEDEKIAKRIARRYGIADDLVEQERAKWQRRKKLEPFKRAARILLLGLCVFLGLITARLIMAESNQLIQVVLGVPVVCMLVLLYWVAFQGMGRILLWSTRKIGIRD
ncbi:MAG: zinc ribbon domain-containing protein [Thermoguttaceae bacterium]